MALSPPDPRHLLRRAGLTAKKSWGQNFLHDRRVLERIAAATAAGPDVPVVELGAGLGALTFHLLQRGGTVVAVERDRELVPLLCDSLGSAHPDGLAVSELAAGISLGNTVVILEADAARLDYADLALGLGSRPVVCGNLPYQISSRILVAVADQARHVRRGVFMVQTEVADRLLATPGREHGLLSVLVQRSMRVERVCKVPRGAFHPQPRVTSAVVRLDPHEDLLDPLIDRRLVAAARAAFHSRRKTLKNSLARALGSEVGRVATAVDAAGLDPGARAETLAVADFARLGRALAEAGLLD